MSETHYFRVAYTFHLPGKRRIRAGKGGIYATEDAALAALLDKSMGATRLTPEEERSFAAFRAKGQRKGSNYDTGPLPSPKPPEPPARTLPTLKEIAGAGYKDPESVLAALKGERAGGEKESLDPPATPPPSPEVPPVVATLDPPSDAGLSGDALDAHLQSIADENAVTPSKEADSIPPGPGEPADEADEGDDDDDDDDGDGDENPEAKPWDDVGGEPEPVTVEAINSMTKDDLRGLLGHWKVPQPPSGATSTDLKATARAALAERTQPQEPVPGTTEAGA